MGPVMHDATPQRDASGWSTAVPPSANQPVNGRPAPRPIRCKLQTPTDIARELAKVYRSAKSGELDVGDASKLANILTCLSRVIEGGMVADLERRLETLEDER